MTKRAWRSPVSALAFAAIMALCATAGAKVKVGGQLQLRYGAEMLGDDPATALDESADAWGQSLSIRRARLKASAKRGRFTLRTHLAFERADPRVLSLFLKFKGPWKLRFRVGQTKRLLTRAYLDSSVHLRLVSRSVVGEEVASNRDVGVVVSRRFFGDRVSSSLALWNGQGANTFGNAIGRFMVEGRVEFAIGARFSTEDQVIGRAPGLLFGGAASSGSVQASRQSGGEQITRYDDTLAWSAFAALRGWGAELVVETVSHDRAPVAANDGVDLAAMGVIDVKQAGWSARAAWQPAGLNGRLGFVGRWSRWLKRRDDPNEGTDRLMAGVTWRLQGDELKLQLQLERRADRRADMADYVRHRAMLQLQGALR